MATGYGVSAVGTATSSSASLGIGTFALPPPSLLFGVTAGQWNRGIATEASRHVIGYGFGMLGFHTIAASTDVGNTASVRVLEKLGMRFDRREVIEGLDTVFFRLRRVDWQANFQAPRENRE